MNSFAVRSIDTQLDTFLFICDFAPRLIRILFVYLDILFAFLPSLVRLPAKTEEKLGGVCNEN